MTETPSHIDLKKVHISLVEPGIILNRVKENSTLEVEDVELMKKYNMELAGGKPYCVLIISEPLSTVSKEARALASSKEFQQITIAKAFVTNNLGHIAVGNFYIKVNRPAIKTKVFKSEEKAMKWLRSFL